MKSKKPARKAPKPSTSLARRKPSAPAKPRSTRSLLPTPKPLAAVEQSRVLTQGISLGDLGLVEIKFTPEEEAVLSEPVPLSELRVKPTGAVYLSHPTYTRWFNRAFGRAGWACVPASTPMVNGKDVVQPYVLYIHGKPVVYAMGEHEYHANNAEQTYGDALESTVASAMRRCAKRLGVGLELWDREWTNNWLRNNAVKVTIEVKKRGSEETEKKKQWRLRNSEPFWNEVESSSRRNDEPRQPARRVPNDSGSHTLSDDPITEKQVSRLWAIIRSSGRSEFEVRDYLKSQFNIAHTKDITRRHYETICAAIEHPQPLPTNEA